MARTKQVVRKEGEKEPIVPELPLTPAAERAEQIPKTKGGLISYMRKRPQWSEWTNADFNKMKLGELQQQVMVSAAQKSRTHTRS